MSCMNEDWKLNFHDAPSSEIKFGTDIRPVFGGVSDYTKLNNKPSINGVELIGNKSNDDLNIRSITNSEIEEFFKRLE